jgi:glycine betaine/proline transport system substrate-binding protein
MAYDCAKPRGWIKKVGWKAGEQKWPCAYEAIRNFKIDNETMGNLIAEVDLEGREVSEVVQEWLDQNQETWKAWTACAG